MERGGREADIFPSSVGTGEGRVSKVLLAKRGKASEGLEEAEDGDSPIWCYC